MQTSERLRSLADDERAGGALDFRLVVEQTRSLVLVTDHTGKIQYANPRLCDLTGFSREEIAGQSIHELGDLPPDTLADLWNTLGFGLPWEGDFEARKKDGRRFWLRASISPVVDAAGSVRQFVAIAEDVSDRRGADRELRESEEKFRALAESSPAGTFVIKSERFVYVSASLVALSGYSAEELTGMPFSRAMHVEFQELVQQRGQARLRGEDVPPQYEVRFVRKDGTVRWGLVRASRVEMGGEPAVIGSLMDITTSKEAEAAVRESEENFRSLAETNPASLFIYDGARLVWANAAAGRISGYSREELQGMDLRALLLGDELHQLAALWPSVLKGEQRRITIRVRRKDGALRWVDFSATLVHYGGRQAILATALDVTSEQEALEALRVSEEKFRTLADTMPAFTFITQGEHFRFVNKGMQEVLGYTEGELLQMHFWDTVHPDHVDIVRERGLARQRGDDVPGGYEVKFVTKDGETRWGLVSAGTMEFEGKPAVVGCVLDVNDRRLAEDAVRASEEKFRLLAETIPALTFIFQDGKFKYVNAGQLPGTEYTPGELADLDIWALLVPESRERVRQRALARSQGDMSPASYEVKYRTKGGRDRWGLLFTAPIAYEGEPATIGTMTDITEVKEAEQALRENQRRLQLALESGGMRPWDSEIRGPLPDGIYGLPKFLSLVSDADRERTMEALRATVEEGAAFREDFRIRTLDGHRWVGCRGLVLRGADGKPARLVGILADITERKTAEQALSESEGKFRAIVESMPAITFIHQDGRFAYWHMTDAMPLPYSSEEILQMNFWEIVHPDHQEMVRLRGIARRRGEDVPNRYEVKLLSRDGGELWGEFFASNITFQGEPAILGTVFDITERKRAEEARRLSEERYRILFQENPTMYFTLAPDLSVLSVNRFGAEHLGYAPEELAGRPALEIVHARDKGAVRRQLQALLAGEAAQGRLEFRKVTKSGDVMWVDETVRRTQDADGNTILLVVCEDVTERRQVEEALQSVREDLERRAEKALTVKNPYGLSFRELTVLHLVIAGRSDKEISVILGIRPLTVSKHVANVLKKMRAASRTEAGVRAWREGLIQ